MLRDAAQECEQLPAHASDQLRALRGQVALLARILAQIEQLTVRLARAAHHLEAPVDGHVPILDGREREARTRARVASQHRSEIVAAHAHVARDPRRAQDRAPHVHQLDGDVADPGRDRARRRPDQRHAHLLVEQRAAVIAAAVVAELFAVIRAYDDGAARLALAKQPAQPADRPIAVGDLALVAAARRSVAPELFRRLVRLVRLEQVHPDEQRMAGLDVR
jgi:hypothetical protein